MDNWRFCLNFGDYLARRYDEPSKTPRRYIITVREYMKVTAAIRLVSRIALWAIVALVLLVAACGVMVYSPWVQDTLTRHLVAYVNRSSEGRMAVSLERLRLRFPLRLSVEGLTVVECGVDTLVSVGELATGVKVAPLIQGRVVTDDVAMTDGLMRLGTPDSLMYMRIKAHLMEIEGVSVGLRNMDISADAAHIASGSVTMALRPDTAATDTAEAPRPEPSAMRIALGKLSLQDFSYTMRMLPTIDTLAAVISHGCVSNVVIDMAEQRVAIDTFGGIGLDAKFIAPDAATVAATPVAPASSDTTAAPWTIEISNIHFARSHALYTTRGVTPAPGLDFAYIEADSLELDITDFYNRRDVVSIPLQLNAIERSGVNLHAGGRLDISSEALKLTDFDISTTDNTTLRASGLLGMGDMMTDPSVALQLQAAGKLSLADIGRLFPAAKPLTAMMPRGDAVRLDLDVQGTSGRLNLRKINVGINNHVNVDITGTVTNAMQPERLGGDIDIHGNIIDLTTLKNNLLGRDMAQTLCIPPMTIDGSVAMHGGAVEGSVQAVTAAGRLALDGQWHSRHAEYSASLTADRFPVAAFMPSAGIGDVSASLDISGRGYNPFDSTMVAQARLDISSATYGGYDYSGITGEATIDGGSAGVALRSTNPDATFALDASGNLVGDTYDWTMVLSGDHIDLKALKMSEEDASLQVSLDGSAKISPSARYIDADVTLRSLRYDHAAGNIAVRDIRAQLNADDSTTNATLRNRDLYTYFSSDAPIDTLAGRMSRTLCLLDSQITRHRVNVDELQRALPPFVLDVSAGNNNILTDILADSRAGFRRLHIEASNDSTLSLSGKVLALRSGTLTLDTISAELSQYGEDAAFTIKMDNAPGTLDSYAHVRLDGFLTDNNVTLRLQQHNISGDKGYDIGARATLGRELLQLRFVPTSPTINYKPWTVNTDNYVTYCMSDKHLDANLHISGGDSSIAIFTEHRGEHHHDGDSDDDDNDSHATAQEDLVVELRKIHLADMVALNPLSTPMSGDLSADMRLNHHSGVLEGNGNVTLTDFYYGKERVGTIGADMTIATDADGMLRAQAELSVDGVRTMTLAGALNDSTATSPLALDFSMIHFPLTSVNPFLPPTLARLRGTLNGSLNITGNSDNPVFDGWLQFDSTAVRAAIIATEYPVSDVKIPVERSKVRFDNFSIKGVNDRSLAINGTVDISSMASPLIDLTLTADNMQICGTSRPSRGADIYGKGFISTNTRVRSNDKYMFVKADVAIEPGTNITYVMPSAVSTITSQSAGEMVRFVNFADTARVEAPDSLTVGQLAVIVDATLHIRSGSTVNVDLSTDGKDRLQLMADGELEFTMSPVNDGRLSGRLSIDKGFVRYTPPLMSEKLFTFSDNSYVAFTGDMMNPQLGIHAVDKIKANVTQEGANSRLVNFDVGLSVTGSLSNMNVGFDLSTADDVTVANELASMSADQRANQAMNMLLYGVYTGPGTKAGAQLSGNPLFSFLESRINSWAASAIKGVDISFGIDQYNKTTDGSTSSTMSYSYQVSKSLFNDRLKIVVGGNYSTDATADENFSQNLINDISFEYYLNKAQTMNVRVFRHTGFESILEGEITEMGVGFVYRRKMRRLSELFKPFNFLKKKDTAPSAAADTTEATAEPAATDSIAHEKD